MSRIGNAPIILPAGVSFEKEKDVVVVKGPKGELSFHIPQGITVDTKGNEVGVARVSESKAAKALHGFVRAQLANDVKGVTKGWSKTLELSGVGYRASLSGTDLVLTIGFSHPVTIHPPTGITFSINEGKIGIFGMNKQLVGQVAADIREWKKPEPYKGKGITYAGEHIRKKAGKSAKAVGAVAGGAK